MPIFRIALGPSYETPAQLVALGLGAVTIASRRATISPALGVGTAFVLAGTVAAVGSDELVPSMYWVVNVGLVLVAVVATLEQPLRLHRIHVHRAIIAFGCVLAAVTLIEQLSGRAVLNSFYLQSLPNYQPGGAAFRPPGLIGNALVLSTVLAIIYSLILVSPAVGRLKLPLLILTGAAVLATLSRSSIATIVLVTALHLIGPSGRHRRLQLAAVVIPAFIYGLHSISGLLTLRSEGQGLIGRSQTLRAARAEDSLELFRDNSMFGVGLGGVKRYLTTRLSANDPAAADNMYLTLLAEIGIFGLFLVIIAGWYLWSNRSSLSSALPIVALLFNGFAFEFLYHDATVILMGFLIADMVAGSKDSGQSVPHRVSEPLEREMASAK